MRRRGDLNWGLVWETFYLAVIAFNVLGIVGQIVLFALGAGSWPLLGVQVAVVWSLWMMAP